MRAKPSRRRSSFGAEYAHQIEVMPVAKLRARANARTHSAEQVETIAKAIDEFSWINPVVVDEQGFVLAGYGRVLAAKLRGRETVPCLRVAHLTEKQKRAYMLADNRIAELAGWAPEILKLELGALREDFDLSIAGFSPADVTGWLGPMETPGGDPDAAPEAPPEEKAVSRRGDVWLLEGHRIMCGDCTQPLDIERLFAGTRPEAIVTDPPYCSGGFQEAGRMQGSIGTKRKVMTDKGAREYTPEIANDRLSTRGYIALMKAALGQVNATLLYCFTDWRMWINLYDVAESSGYGVRSMIVWDKGSPALGSGWRSQHEIILFASKARIRFSGKVAQGNVVQSKRTGNPLHPTQKPVDLLRKIISTTDMAATWYDPFVGSGSTLVAIHDEGRQGFGMELTAPFADVSVLRLQEHTGKQATLEASGATFEATAAERLTRKR